MRPTHFRQKMRRASTSGRGLALLTLLSTLAFAGTASAATAVPLGSLNNFAVLAGSTVTNVPAAGTVVNGDLGVSPGTAITGFPPGVVNGTIHSADAAARQAQLDLTAAYDNAAAQPVTTTTGTQLGGSTLGPGVYAATPGPGFLNITGTLTLDGQGNPNAVFIFQAASTLVTAAGPGASRVNLINGAQACNVFWQVGSSATLGTFSDFSGNILALTSIAAQTSAVINGRLLARNGAVTLDQNTITRAQCAPDVVGPTVTISGVPKACTDFNFKLKVRVSDPAGIARTDVFLDGKRIKRSSKTFFTVTIKAKELAPGRHKIRVVSRDDAGNTRVRKSSFQRCEPAAIKFTG